MKMSQSLYDLLHQSMQKSVNHLGMEYFRDAYKGLTLKRMLFDLLYFTTYDLMYDDTHPAYQNGRVRINPHVPGFDIYEKDSLNDEHIFTALKKIGKEIGLVDSVEKVAL